MAYHRSSMNFFDIYPEFYKTSKTHPFRNRLNGRYNALIKNNLALIQEQTILDIASHDGRWSFAAIKNGAKKVIGIEARQYLVESAIKNMQTYNISEDKYTFIAGDIHYEITKLEPNTIDIVFCFGFFYHTMNHMQILREINRLNPKNLILDTSVSIASDLPIIELREDDSDKEGTAMTSSYDPNKMIMVGSPNKNAVKLMLTHIGFDFNFYDWHSNTTNWDHLEDYRESRRISIVSTKRGTVSNKPDGDILRLRSLVQNKQFEIAATYALRYIDDHEKDPEWNYLTAFCLHIINTVKEKALEYYNKALSLDYNEFWVRYNRGSLYFRLGKIAEAKKDLLRAIEIDPSNQGPPTILRLLENNANELLTKTRSLNSPIFICTVPKSGTHLIRGILAQIFGTDFVFLSDSPGVVPNEIDILSEPQLENKIYVGHFHYSEKFSTLVANFPKILLVRDPRDYVISQAYYMDSFKRMESPLEKRFRELPSWKHKVSASIFGMTECKTKLASVNEIFINHCIKWLSSPNSLLVRFEDIVGSQFGGNTNRMVKTIQSILEFIGYKVEDEEKLFDDIFLGSDPAKSGTFRSGNIGSWRLEFDEDHVKQFKLVAPGLVSRLGYEKDDTWDLGTNSINDEDNNNHGKNTTLVYEKKEEEPFNPNLHTLNSLAFEKDSSSLMGRYEELLKLTSYSEVLAELVNAWAVRSFVDRGEYRQTLPILDKLLSNKPHDPEWNYYKAFCLQYIGENLQQAVNHYNIALASGFDEFWVRYNRGALFKSLGEVEKAHTDLQRAVLLYPTAEVAYKMLSEIEEMISKPKPFVIVIEELNQIRELINQAEFEKASSLLEDLLKKYPDNAESNYLYALCLHMQKKDFRRALQHYNLAFEYGFDEYWVKYNRGSLLEQLGDVQAAMKDIKRALELKPDDFGAMSVLRSIQSKKKLEA
jgi:tetratricopeptide (TPR) repeat protein